MRYLILGGNGFVGKHLCSTLCIDNQVTVFDLGGPAQGEKIEGVKYVSGDFREKKDIDSVMNDCDVVFHLLSTTLPKKSNDNPVVDVRENVLSTITMLDMAVKYKVKKIVFSSSGGTIYGVAESVPIAESHQTNPICSYGITKLTIEKYLHLYYHLHGLGYVSLRLSNLYGEGQSAFSEQGAVGVFIGKIISNQDINIWGDGSVVRDYIHISDAIRAFVLAAEYAGDKKVFNIGSGTGVSLNELVDKIESLSGINVPRIYHPARSLDVPANILDNSLAATELGWHVENSLMQGLTKTLNCIQPEVSGV